MNDLTRLREALADVDPGESKRADGWTGARRRQFLEIIAEGRTVENACGVVGLSVASAYALRRRAEAFALAWRAAQLLGRERLADIFTTRAIDGQVDTWVRADGQEVTRHRYDNRLGLAMLARLDRYAERRSPADGASTPAEPSPDDAFEAAKVIAADFPAFLDLVESDADAGTARAWVAEGMRRRLQLPQLRRGADGADGLEAASPYWWDAADEDWYTALPPPFDFQGSEYGVPGEPAYHRTLTRDETDIAEALAGEVEEEED